MNRWSSILSSPWTPNPPASEAALEVLQASVPFQLSGEYMDLLRWANGGAGWVGEVYLSIWPVEAVARLNEGYLISTNLPTVFVIGDDSSHFYGFDHARPNPEVVRFPVGFVHPAGINVRDPSLERVLYALATRSLH